MLTESQIDELTALCIHCACAAIEDYVQHNGNNLPIAITANKQTGWSYAHSKPSKSLVEIVESLIGKQIILEEFDAQLSSSIDSVCIEFVSRAEIRVNKGLNFCWRRFFVAKELTHLLINAIEPKIRTKTIEEFNQQIQHLSPTFTPKYFSSASEALSFIGATEILMPNSLVDFDQLASQIAEKTKSPKKIVEARLQPDSTNAFLKAYSNSNCDNALLKFRSKKANNTP